MASSEESNASRIVVIAVYSEPKQVSKMRAIKMIMRQLVK
ncbi:hypothetical protein GBL_2514 [Geobacillus kaustophilus GBlys]|uniref:Uncharacterized protein n=1 Tax=Geobacillus kaustophilus GBlys TaxID=1337888 RepID=U2X6C2_GEOKU|nr:hypothetical protein GBL_2514 [Geobacillus kaustophilus GBlys]